MKCVETLDSHISGLPKVQNGVLKMFTLKTLQDIMYFEAIILYFTVLFHI